jgi:hypothetical protein
MRKKKFRVFVPVFALALIPAISGCHSHHIDSMIDNRTGAIIHQVEIDYPSASFGIDTLAPGQVYDYKFQVQGKGPIKIQYTDSAGKQVQLRGSTLSEGDEGQYVIVLLPDGKAQWAPSLEPRK